MKISLNQIKKYLPDPLPVDTTTLVELIGSRLVEVEKVIDLQPKYQGIFIVKVVAAEKIPDTHLTLCQIDAGPSGADFAGENNLVQVVCGAPNVYAGMYAVWIAPGSIVPSTFDSKPFQLKTIKLRGYNSSGMLAAVDELDLGSDHQGILEIDPKFAQPGDSFADKFDLNDIILDIENKSLTHRPDTFGLIGFAREISGILGLKFSEPSALTVHHLDIDPKNIKIKLEPELCSRYSVAIFDYTSPEDLYFTPQKALLIKSGLRPVSPLVDLTNLLMLEFGQPLHAFDYDKFLAVGGTDHPVIGVRTAHPGETITLIDQKTIECDSNDILITSNDLPVALAGAMGGENTAVDQHTKTVLLESASFSLYHLRKTQMKHGIFSEAITRFTKGQPAGITFPTLSEAISRLGVKTVAVADQFAIDPIPNVVEITTDEINRLLGTDYSSSKITDTLTNVGFLVQNPNSQLRITAPYWRTDIKIKEDIIEEIGRLLGYDNIPKTLPERPFRQSQIDPILKLKTKLRNLLSDQLSAHEVLTYSFVSQKLLQDVGQNPENSYQIINSLSPELQLFRQHLTPSLLEKIRPNLRSGHQDFTLYEFNQVSSVSSGLNSEQVPILQHHLTLTTFGDYYQARQKLIFLLEKLQFKPEFRALNPKLAPYLEPLHSADIYVGDDYLGSIGEIKVSVLNRLKLTHAVSSFEINLETLLKLTPSKKIIPPLSKFPSTTRDLTIKLSADINFQSVFSSLSSYLASVVPHTKILPLSIYQAPASNTKNLSFRLTFISLEKTFTSDEIADIMDEITKHLATEFSAVAI